MPKVLLMDGLHPAATELLQNRKIKATVGNGLAPTELAAFIEEEGFDGLIVRSKTIVTPTLLQIPSLKIVGRAGSGVDNIDIKTATKNGIVVMNAPGANSISVAEHVFGLIFAMTRHIPAANESTKNGLWEKQKFNGIEIYGKTMGVVGAGNIGSLVAKRAAVFGMKVKAFDPYLTKQRKEDLEANVPDIEFVTLPDLIKGSDVITLHTPKQEKQLLDANAFQDMKEGVYIINCAREGLIDKAALKEGIENGRVAGAALDVFSKEKAKQMELFEQNKIIFTPHIGAATKDAQRRVAETIVTQVGTFLLGGPATNAVNRPAFLRRHMTTSQAAVLAA